MELAPSTSPAPPLSTAAATRPVPRPVWRDVNVANGATGATAVLWYAFGPIPVFLGVMAALEVPPPAAASWFFITFLTSGVASVLFSLRARMPLAFGWTMPGLVFL